jgi:hypothetical protein
LVTGRIALLLPDQEAFLGGPPASRICTTVEQIADHLENALRLQACFCCIPCLFRVQQLMAPPIRRGARHSRHLAGPADLSGADETMLRAVADLTMLSAEEAATPRPILGSVTLWNRASKTLCV